MKLKSLLLATVLGTTLIVPMAALAAPVHVVKQRSTEIPMIDTEQKANLDTDVKYVTGGIGEDERMDLEAVKADYNVRITNARKTGAFVEDTHVVISRKMGKEFEPILDVNAGPLTYVELPAGSYLVEATRYGETKKKNLVVKAKSTKASDFGFYWVPPVEKDTVN